MALQPVKAGWSLTNTKGNGAGNNLTTITAFVTVAGQAGAPFVLTCGHSFFDADPQNATPLPIGPPNQNNYTGITPPGIPVIPAAQQVGWAFKRSNYPTIATSYLQYHCPGDKLGSHFDGGLAQLNTAGGVQQTRVTSSGWTVNGYDANLPPANNPANSDLYIGANQMLQTPANRGHLIYLPQIVTADNLTYDNVYVIRTDDPENGLPGLVDWRGMSGTGLYRVALGARPDQNNPPPATLIAYFCSKASAVVGANPATTYYIFQCMGPVVAGLNINGIP